MTAINMEFNERKSLQAVLYIANRLARRDFHKIFKVLYFSDRDHLIKYGRTITGDQYIAMEDGPVPSKIYDIFKAVRGDGYYKDDGTFSAFFEVENWDLLRPKQDAELKALSKTDIHFLDKNLELYRNTSWDEVREKSHDYAWRSTIRNRPISFENLIIEAGGDKDFI
ncbi:MAG: SocA family protein, partial [Chitinophagaceae bacterium]|nr:SocA family protein [Chitinophagaceae bacterium]